MMLGKIEKTLIGAVVGVGANVGVQALVHGGRLNNPVAFDKEKATIALVAEGGLAVLNGMFFGVIPGAIAGITALGLYAMDMTAARTAGAPAMMPAPNTAPPKTPTNPLVQKLPTQLQPIATAVAPLLTPLTSLITSLVKPSAPAPTSSIPGMVTTLSGRRGEVTFRY